MNYFEISKAIQEVLAAQSEQELTSILTENSLLLEIETFDALVAMLQKAKQNGMGEVSEILQTAVDRIAHFAMYQVESESSQSTQPTSSIELKVGWAIKARKHIALGEGESLTEAIAEAQGQPEIVTFLQSFAEGDMLEIVNLAKQLILKLQQVERHEEALTISLLNFHTGAGLVESYINYPYEEQKEAREFGIEACQNAIQIAQTLDDKPCHAFFLGRLANGFRYSRQLREAEHFYSEALQLYRNVAEREPRIFNQELAKTLNNLGVVQDLLRMLADAEKSYAEALELYRDLAKQKPHIFNLNLTTTLNNLGIVQKNLRKFSDAKKSYLEALELNRDLAKQKPTIFNQELAKTLINLGNVYREMRELTDAEKSFLEALKLYQDLAQQKPDIFNQYVAHTLNNLGTAQRENAQKDMRKLADAEESFTEALQIYQELAKQEPHIFNLNVSATLNNLGIVESDMGKLADSEKYYLEALQIYRDLAKLEPHIFNLSVSLTLNNLGSLKLNQNKLDEAKENFESARDLIEDLRAKAIMLDDRNRILQGNINVYSNLLTCYIRMKNWKKALEISELGKSRSLSDLLNLKSEDLQPKAPTSDTLAIVKDLGRKYSDAIKELQQIESYERHLSEQLSQFENDIKRIENNEDGNDDTRQDSLRETVREKQSSEDKKRKSQDKRFAKQSELKSVLEEINKYDKDFPPKAKEIDADGIFEISKNQNRTIVMFRILHESTAVIFVFPTGEFHVEEIKGFGQKEMSELFLDKWLNPYLQWKNRKVGIGVWRNAIEQTLDTVYEKLIIHVHQVLKEKSDSREVLFVPNQSLALLPLHAANWTDEAGKRHYLLEEYTISYAPSVSVFKRCQDNEKQRSNKTLFVTNPTGDLDSSEEEVKFIENLHQDYKNLSKEDATKSAVIEALREDYGFTHFSCHGSYNQQNPFESGLQMFFSEIIKKPEAVIKLSEIINSNLQNNWLTTLSACETGMVDFASPTDEHFGLPLGFIFAGSPSVWASLWSVSDSATSELMQKAYENLSQEEYKNNKPEALRQAQLSMINDKDSAHPFFWAGFQHFGA